MAYTLSNMLPLGTVAPEFTLVDPLDGKKKSLDELKSDQATVIMFICNHCPYVIHLIRDIVDTAEEYMEKGVRFVAISPNDVENYPDDSPDRMALIAKVLQFPFPYLFDETQEVAKAYDAACTPDFYIFDRKMELAYRGQYDDSRPSKDVPVTGKDFKAALDAVLAGDQPSDRQVPSGGCNIKWKK
ncbi:thioredoxin family protein [Membranicola marinus]|uniref:Thioredoxin family protein n=1 Tax=Membranihabitans marinus TaxID=1227546 RepID=A0A953HTY6_9BACT|nr:thioredoxin family protein [Membranihabitans marinus]MBY5958161.1 thioredoxin family protein [Membranihabitans marinus]